jgi:hypothetical protein
VRRGDSLSKIAQLFYGDLHGWKVIAQANGLRHPYLIIPGMTLTIPRAMGRANTVHGPEIAANVARPTSPGLSTATGRIPNSPALSHPGAIPPMLLPRATLVQYPRIPFKLDECTKPIEYFDPPLHVKLQFTGELTLKKEGDIGSLTFTKSGFAGATIKTPNGTYELDTKGKLGAEIKSQYQTKLADFTSGVTFDRKGGEVAVSCKLSIAAKVNGRVFATQSYQPILGGIRYTYEPQPIKGESDGYEFEGKVGYVLEIRIDRTAGDESPVPVLVPSEISVVLGAAAVAVVVVVLLPEELVVGAVAAVGAAAGAAAEAAGSIAGAAAATAGSAAADSISWRLGWSRVAGVALAAP